MQTNKILLNYPRGTNIWQHNLNIALAKMIPMIFAKKKNLIDNSPFSIVSDTLAIKCMLPIKMKAKLIPWRRYVEINISSEVLTKPKEPPKTRKIKPIKPPLTVKIFESQNRQQKIQTFLIYRNR